MQKLFNSLLHCTCLLGWLVSTQLLVDKMLTVILRQCPRGIIIQTRFDTIHLVQTVNYRIGLLHPLLHANAPSLGRCRNTLTHRRNLIGRQRKKITPPTQMIFNLGLACIHKTAVTAMITLLSPKTTASRTG